LREGTSCLEAVEWVTLRLKANELFYCSIVEIDTTNTVVVGWSTAQK
jgi:hypothetical protein